MAYLGSDKPRQRQVLEPGAYWQLQDPNLRTISVSRVQQPRTLWARVALILAVRLVTVSKSRLGRQGRKL